MEKVEAGRGAFAVEKVAVGYLRWHRSRPFDIGGTTSTGLFGGDGQPAGKIHEGMWRAAARHNSMSKANGGLMRIAPLGVWGWRLSEEALVEAACSDSRLTHSHLTYRHAAAVYCLAIRHLMNHPGDSGGAFRTAEEWAEKLENTEVRSWLSQAAEGEDVGYAPHIGFVMYGFTHAFRHLKKRTPYPEAIFETLKGGGDTDTNACIVGGLAGALHGEGGIPASMREALYSCDTRRGHIRSGGEYAEISRILRSPGGFVAVGPDPAGGMCRAGDGAGAGRGAGPGAGAGRAAV